MAFPIQDIEYLVNIMARFNFKKLNAMLGPLIVRNKNMLNIPGHTWLGQEQHWLATDRMIQTSFCFKNDNV